MLQPGADPGTLRQSEGCVRGKDDNRKKKKNWGKVIRASSEGGSVEKGEWGGGLVSLAFSVHPGVKRPEDFSQGGERAKKGGPRARKTHSCQQKRESKVHRSGNEGCVPSSGVREWKRLWVRV